METEQKVALASPFTPEGQASPKHPRSGFLHWQYGTLGWGIFILITVAAVFIAMGAPSGPLWIFGAFVAVLFAYRFPYLSYGMMVALVPFLGLTVSLSTGELAIGQTAFGGSIDIFLGELVAMAVLAAWGLKIFFLWVKRNDVNWKPWLPLFIPMAALVGAHLLSAFSPFQPGGMLVVKYALRPVFWCYLIYVVLTVNLVRSRRRLYMTLGVIAATGIFAALMGFISLWVVGGADQILSRARPLPMFGVMPLGDNHNLLAEWLTFTVPATIALAYLATTKRARRFLAAATVLQVLIALLTFARTAWIVLAVEAVLLAWFVWREQVKRWASAIIVFLVFLLPLGFAMVVFSSSATVQSSTSTRLMLTEIALNLWRSSPWIGAGAGTFVERVGSTRVFVIEYGDPLDSHGIIQKLLAETGIVGIAAMAWFVIAAALFVRKRLPDFRSRPVERSVFLVLAIAAAGAFVYQLFNTNYWNGKLWLPLGIMLASWRSLLPRTPSESAEAVDWGAADRNIESRITNHES
jgi:O-antigen ligase